MPDGCRIPPPPQIGIKTGGCIIPHITITGGQSNRTITVNPEVLDSVSKLIKGKHDEYITMYNDLMTKVTTMGNAWIGADNQEYVNKISALRADFEKMASVIEEYTVFLTNSAVTYRNKRQDNINNLSKLKV